MQNHIGIDKFNHFDFLHWYYQKYVPQETSHQIGVFLLQDFGSGKRRVLTWLSALMVCGVHIMNLILGGNIHLYVNQRYSQYLAYYHY